MTNETEKPATKRDLDGMELRLGDRIEASIGDLARITKDGFDAVDKRFDGVDRRLDTLDRGQEDIHMRLTEVAYKIDVTDLTRRVDKIEHKVGISNV